MVAKMKKNIIGFMGASTVGKTTAADVLVEKGFYKVSLSAKVREFAEQLFSPEELEDNRDEILARVRHKGNQAHKGYWLNLTLVSIPDTADKIVIDDLTPQDLPSDVIQVYAISRPECPRIWVDDCGFIENDGDLSSFKTKVEQLVKK